MSQIHSIQSRTRQRQGALSRATPRVPPNLPLRVRPPEGLEETWQRPGVSSSALRQTVLDALLRVGLAADSDHAPLRLAPAGVATAPAQLAAAQTADRNTRRELIASYELCLRSYRDIARLMSPETAPETAPDTADDDLGAALAFFVAANLHALHGVDVESESLLLLERQLRGVCWRASNWDAASLGERQAFFERIAILAVLVCGSHASVSAQAPGAVAKLRHAAREYLQQLLGLDPELLTLGPVGLVARDSAAPTGADAAPAGAGAAPRAAGAR